MDTRIARILEYLRRRAGRRPPAWTCIYCDRPYADRADWPYCSAGCAAQAEQER